MNADGSGQSLIAPDKWLSDPAWSPDGTRIAYGTEFDGTFVVNADGSSRTRLHYGKRPAWSPDGTRIAVDGLTVMNADGSGQNRLTESGYGPTWSPNGLRIAFYDGPNMWVIDADSSTGGTASRQSLLTTEGYYPDWSPDGRRIAYEYDGSIYLMNADGSSPARLTAGGGPDWSPDGRQLAFTCPSGQLVPKSDFSICVIDADGKGLRNLTDPWRSVRMAAIVLTPALVWLPLLVGLTASSLYSRRHTQQALMLAALRALAALVLLAGLGTGLVPWFVVNGTLWLFGSVWGLNQVARGDCWLMRLRGEGAQLPRPWAARQQIAVTVGAPAEQLVEAMPVEAAPAVASVAPEAQAAFDQGLAFLAANRRDDAVAALMMAFRQGDELLRQRALAELQKLGEVEQG
jgi:hypothetical protein